MQRLDCAHQDPKSLSHHPALLFHALLYRGNQGTTCIMLIRQKCCMIRPTDNATISMTTSAEILVPQTIVIAKRPSNSDAPLRFGFSYTMQKPISKFHNLILLYP